MAEKPTKKFLMDQIESLQKLILLNQGSLNMCKGMLEKGIYVEEEEKEDGDSIESPCK